MTELFLDTADLDAARDLLGSGLFAGVTTNPLLIERAGLTAADLPRLVESARDLGLKRIFVQAWGNDERELSATSDWIRQLGDSVGVKLPVTPPGLAVTRRLVERGVPVLVTAVYHAKQLVLADAVGATYVAPYVGRMTDQGRDGIAETLRMQRILAATGSRTRLLVASLRSVREVVELAEGGVEAFTISPALAAELTSDPLTDVAVADFERAAAAADVR